MPGMRQLLTLLAVVGTAGVLVGPVSPGTPPFRATLTTSGHTPRVGQPWYYTIRITDLNGKPIAARIVPVVRAGTRNIDTVGFFQIYGVCGHPYVWQPAHRGRRLVFQVSVRTESGVRRLNYWVRPR
jgi:hypothetical protein